MQFHTPNRITKKRLDTLYTKEPDTIQWLNGLTGILYDIGANVGMYSIYAGLKGIEVYAFEPESQNYAVLNKNIQLNGLNNVHAFNIAINDSQVPTMDYLNLSTTEAGGSLHTFKDKLDYRLQPFEPVYRQGCIGLSLDDIAKQLPLPNHIKIDVDGIEHLVVEGGMETIKQADSVLIEINRNIWQHINIIDWMVSNDFWFDPEQVEQARRKAGPMKNVGNYIFSKVGN